MSELTANFDAAIERAAEGATLDQIAAALGCSSRHLFRLTEKHPSFGKSLLRARELGLQLQGDRLRTMVKDNPETDVQRLKLESDNIKWVLSKLLPRIFGDRIDVNVTERVDVSLAITEAKRRVLRSGSDLEQIEDAQVVELPTLSNLAASDETSVSVPAPVQNPFDD